MKRFKTSVKNWAKRISRYRQAPISAQVAYAHRLEHLSDCALNCSTQGVSDERYCQNEVIVSLTTYGRRLHEAYLAIESIMQQTLKPNRLILWLSNELRNADMPRVLLRQKERGLEIRFCDDIKSYKKLIPTLAAFPSATVITVDDDCLYNFDLLENMVNAHRGSPEIIFSARMHRIKLRSDGKLAGYAKWTHQYEGFDASPLNFPTGCGGVLYPPNSFNDEVFNEKAFTGICQYADDVWFKAMALLNGVATRKSFTRNKDGNDFLLIEAAQSESLGQINIDNNMNDVQLKAVFDKYDLYRKLKAEPSPPG